GLCALRIDLERTLNKSLEFCCGGRVIKDAPEFRRSGLLDPSSLTSEIPGLGSRSCEIAPQVTRCARRGFCCGEVGKCWGSLHLLHMPVPDGQRRRPERRVE